MSFSILGYKKMVLSILGALSHILSCNPCSRGSQLLDCEYGEAYLARNWYF